MQGIGSGTEILEQVAGEGILPLSDLHLLRLPFEIAVFKHCLKLCTGRDVLAVEVTELGDFDIVSQGRVLRNVARCNCAVVTVGAAADLLLRGVLDKGCIGCPVFFRFNLLADQRIGNGAFGVFGLERQTAFGQPAHGTLCLGVVLGSYRVGHKIAKERSIDRFRRADGRIAHGVDGLVQLRVSTVLSGQGKLDLSLGSCCRIRHILPHLFKAQLGIVETRIDVAAVIAAGKHGVSKLDFVGQASLQRSTIGIIPCCCCLVGGCRRAAARQAQFAKRQGRCAAILHLVGVIRIGKQHIVAAFRQIGEGIAAKFIGFHRLHRVAQRIGHAAVWYTVGVRVQGSCSFTGLLLLQQRYGNASQQLVRANILHGIAI